MFIHLRAYSHYSFLRGLASPAELVEAAVRFQQPCMGLTDYGTLAGAVEFYDACQSAGIKPILGLELPVQLPGSTTMATWNAGNQKTSTLTLLATNLTGWTNLSRLSSNYLNRSGAEKSDPLPVELLTENSEGVICLAGPNLQVNGWEMTDHSPNFTKLIRHLEEFFRKRIYIDLQMHTAADLKICLRWAQLAHQMKLPAVATHPTHFIDPDQAAIQRVVAAIRLIKPWEQLNPEEMAPPNAHMVPPIEMEEIFNAFPAALENTWAIAEQCNLDLPVCIPHYPTIPDLKTSPDLALRARAEQGVRDHYGTVTPEISERLNYELSIINQFGYAAIFLIMEDILRFAKESGIPYSSRGSAASSLVAHCLGITSPDPLGLNLYFERFLNPARAKPPDIDTDLCSRRRDEVIRYVYERYGQDRVAMVSTINRFRSRSALREVAKAYGLSPAQITRLTDSLPDRWYGPPNTARNSTDSPYAAMIAHYQREPYPSIFRDAEAIIGLPHHASIHPGGIVIAPGVITDLAPTQLAAKGIVTTQFDLESIERMGLIKIDLLGIRGLTVLGEVVKQITAAEATESPIAIHSLDDIPDVDPDTEDLIARAATIGCFQIESPGMRLTLRELQARTEEDIMAALALFRPGPLTGGYKNQFVQRYRNRHLGLLSPNPIHPSLETTLEDSCGIILYQEQVLRIAHDLAGLSLADADLLRRAMSHFDPGKQMETLKARFIQGAISNQNIPPAIAEQIWEMMAAFAGYGFPKAHAASYAQVAWRSAWCKSHFPAQFMAAVLANWGGYYSQRVYLTEARRLGLDVRPPHINYSLQEFSVAVMDGKPKLFMGLDQVRELTRNTQARIIAHRPFANVDDFLQRVKPRQAEAKNLVRCGALKGFGTIPALLHKIDIPGKDSRQLSLFSKDRPGTKGDQPEDWSLPERILAQEEILGAGVDAHPLELLEEKIRAEHPINTIEAIASRGNRVRVAGMRQAWRRSRTMRGESIYFLSLEDLEGMIDVIIPQSVYQANRAAFSNPGPYLIEGMMDANPTTQEPVLRAERIQNLRS